MHKFFLFGIFFFTISNCALADNKPKSDVIADSISITKLQQQRIGIHEKLFSLAQQTHKLGRLNQHEVDLVEIELLQVKLIYETQKPNRIELLTRLTKLERERLASVDRDFSVGAANQERRLQQESRLLHAEIQLLSESQK